MELQKKLYAILNALEHLNNEVVAQVDCIDVLNTVDIKGIKRMKKIITYIEFSSKEYLKELKGIKKNGKCN